MNVVTYIGLAVAGGGVYRSGLGRVERLAHVSGAPLPASHVRLILARAILGDVLVGAPPAELVDAFAEEMLGEVERVDFFSLAGACVHTWLTLRGDLEPA